MLWPLPPTCPTTPLFPFPCATSLPPCLKYCQVPRRAPLQKYLWTATPVLPVLPPSGDNMHHGSVKATHKVTCQRVAAYLLNSTSTYFSSEGTGEVSPLAQPLIFIKLLCIQHFWKNFASLSDLAGKINGQKLMGGGKGGRGLIW